jgi:hypothetical protein
LKLLSDVGKIRGRQGDPVSGKKDTIIAELRSIPVMLAWREIVVDQADVVQDSHGKENQSAAAKIEGAIGLGSLLFPPLAIAGAEGLGLFGAGLGGSAAADGLAGSTISGGGRAVAGSAARQAISEAEASSPEGMTRKDFGRLAGFEQGLAASNQASTEATALESQIGRFYLTICCCLPENL